VPEAYQLLIIVELNFYDYKPNPNPNSNPYIRYGLVLIIVVALVPEVYQQPVYCSVVKCVRMPTVRIAYLVILILWAPVKECLSW
jgi:hypothetical protein